MQGVLSAVPGDGVKASGTWGSPTRYIARRASLAPSQGGLFTKGSAPLQAAGQGGRRPAWPDLVLPCLGNVPQ